MSYLSDVSPFEISWTGVGTKEVQKEACWRNIKIKTSFLLHHYKNFCTLFTTDLDELHNYGILGTTQLIFRHSEDNIVSTEANYHINSLVSLKYNVFV